MMVTRLARGWAGQVAGGIRDNPADGSTDEIPS